MGFSDRLLIAVVAWGALAFGAVYPWAYWPMAVVAAGLGVRAMVVTRAWNDPRVRVLATAFGAVALAIALQLVALPYAWLQRLSPAVDPFLREYQLAYLPASTRALSLVPASTTAALGLFVALALLLLGVSSVLRGPRLEWLVTQIMGLGVGLAILAVVQKALLAPEQSLVYGFWKPRGGSVPYGPFINRNHFAGWMVMAIPLVVGYSCALVAGASGRPEEPRWRDWVRWVATIDAGRVVLVVCSAIVMALSLIFTLSRSGSVAFAVSMLVFAGLSMRIAGQRSVRWLIGGYAGALVLLVVLWAGSETIDWFVFAERDAPGRLLAWADTVRIIQDFPVFGVGLGAFGRAMLVYQTHGRDFMYAQSHNDYLQLAAEGGLLVGVPAVVALLVVMGLIRRRLRGDAGDPLRAWVRRGAVAGLVGIAAQSLVDFSLQMPGNTVLCTMLLAIAVHRGRSDGTSYQGAYARRV